MSGRTPRYLVCSVPRSGSTYFCHLLGSTGSLGMQPYDRRRYEHILRYFRDGFEGVDWSSTGVAELFDAAFAASATPNGAMGFKVMWEHFDRILDEGRRLGRDRGMSRLEAEKRIAGETKFVWLRRRNEVRQAVSWNKALQSNGWNIEAQQEYRGRYVYDFPGIALARRRIRRAETAWERFFERCGVEPLVLYYEDYLADIPAALRAVAELLGLPPPANIAAESRLLQVQSDALSEEWEQRFRRDSRGLLSSARALAAAIGSRAWLESYLRRATERSQARAYAGR